MKIFLKILCLNFFSKLAATPWKFLMQIQSHTLYAAEVCLGWQFELKFSFMGKGPLSNERRTYTNNFSISFKIKYVL